MGDTTEDLVNEARRLGEDDCLHSEKGHFLAARAWRIAGYSTGGLIAVLGAVIGAIEFNKWDVTGEVLGTLAVVIAAISALMTFLNPQARAQAHHTMGNHYSALRGKLRRFATIGCGSGKPEPELVDLLEALAERKDNLNHEGSPVPTWAYRLAERGIRRGEASYAIDETP